MSKMLASLDMVNHQLWKEHLPISLTACRVLGGLGKHLVYREGSKGTKIPKFFSGGKNESHGLSNLLTDNEASPNR